MIKHIRWRLFLLASFSFVTSEAQYQFEFLNQADDRLLERQLHQVQEDRVHTGSRPLRSEDTPNIDSIQALHAFSGKISKSWWGRKAFNERLVVVETPGFSWRLDPLVDFSYGYESAAGANRNLYVNTRGFLMEGRIGKDVSFITTFRENQALLPYWVESFVGQRRVVPGQGLSRKFQTGVGLDFNQATGVVNYHPSPYFNFSFGHGQNFFGEGHRSLFLSDNAFSYPYLRIETTVWKIKYVNLYNFMTDIRPEVEVNNTFARKYTTMHYLSINLGKRWNINFFEAIVWSDSALQRGFDVNFLNPIIFYRPIEFARGSDASNALLGFGASYLIKDQWMAYGQILLDEFSSRDIIGGKGSWKNKFAWQLGMKGYDLFGVDNLFGRLEYNAARPYTYSHLDVITNYGHYNQELAHPWGANFHEIVVQAAYDFKRYGAEFQFNWGIQGNDDNQYFGRGIYTSYNERPFDDNHNIGKYNGSRFYFLDLRTYYMINPAIRLRLELSYTLRSIRFNEDASSGFSDSDDSVIGFALRTNIFNRYYDF